MAVVLLICECVKGSQCCTNNKAAGVSLDCVSLSEGSSAEPCDLFNERSRCRKLHLGKRPCGVVLQVPVRSSHGSSGCPVAVDRLSCAQSDPQLLLTSCSDGTMKLFDLRASITPALSIHAGKGGLAGMVLEPCGKPGTIVTGERLVEPSTCIVLRVRCLYHGVVGSTE